MHLILFIIQFLLKFALTIQKKNDISVWGPGLKPQFIVMPARYFFIKATSNDNLLSSDFDINVQGTTILGKPCRIWYNILDSKKNFYIVRYKVYETCKDLIINVKYKNEHVSESPYIIKEIVYSDDCNCPVDDFNNWLKSWECREIPDQLQEDLKLFKNVDWNIIRNKVIEKYDRPAAVSLCHYLTKENKIYRKCYGKYVGFKTFMDNMLLSLSRKFKLPDLEFFVNLGDWPLVKDDLFPIFSWCGSTDTFDIVMPTYDIAESTLENMGRVMLDMLSVQGNAQMKWEERIPKIFWRGRDSNRHRLNLINISREYPELFNVSLTNFFFFRNEEHLYGPKSEHVSFFKFFDYKYQLSIDGTVAAYRFPYLLAGGSLIFKQDSKYYEHFYRDLIKNVHYIPIKIDLSDLIEKINWAINNDNEVKKIALNAQQFANEHLLPKNIFCFYAHLLTAFKKKIISDVKVLPDMEEVISPKHSNQCKCIKTSKDEL